MSSPQLENGHLRIANELYEQILLAGFSKRELLVVLAIIRETYGYNRKAHRISGSTVGRMTRIKRQHAAETIAALARRRVVLKQDHTGYNVLSLNKNYREWGSPKTGLVPKQDQGSPKTGSKVVPKRDTTKDSKNRSKNKGAKAPELPHWLPCGAWQQWVQHRSEIRKPLKPSTVAAQIRKLDGYRQQGHEPADVIEHSIAGGWTGLFPEKINGTRKQSPGDRVKAAYERILADEEANGEPLDADGKVVWTQVDDSLRRD